MTLYCYLGSKFPTNTGYIALSVLECHFQSIKNNSKTYDLIDFWWKDAPSQPTPVEQSVVERFQRREDSWDRPEPKVPVVWWRFAEIVGDIGWNFLRYSRRVEAVPRWLLHCCRWCHSSLPIQKNIFDLFRIFEFVGCIYSIYKKNVFFSKENGFPDSFSWFYPPSSELTYPHQLQQRFRTIFFTVFFLQFAQEFSSEI